LFIEKSLKKGQNMHEENFFKMKQSEANEAIAIKELFEALYLSERDLTAGQMDFIEGCKKHFKRNKSLSEKQLSALRDIKKYISGSQTAQRYSMKII